MSNFLLDSISLFVARRAGIAPMDNSSAMQATRYAPAASRPGTGEHFEADRDDHAQRATDAQLPLVEYPVLREAVTPPEVRRSRSLSLLRTSAGIAVTSRLTPATQAKVSRHHESHQATVFLTEPTQQTLAVGLYGLIADKRDTNFGSFAAGTLLTAVPTVILFYSLQRYIIGGLTAGSVKG